MNGKAYKEEIERVIKRAKEQCPNITDDMLDSEGAIYYMNGNDSTRFDWNLNDRLCEFMVFHKNEVGFIKANVNRDGTIDVYIYEDAGLNPTQKLDETLGVGNAGEFAALMDYIADNNYLWNELLDKLDWDIDTAVCVDIDDEPSGEDDDWW